MTISDAFNAARVSIYEVANQYHNQKITKAEAEEQQAAILELYDDQVQRIRSAELAKHTHDFSIP